MAEEKKAYIIGFVIVMIVAFLTVVVLLNIAGGMRDGCLKTCMQNHSREYCEMMLD